MASKELSLLIVNFNWSDVASHLNIDNQLASCGCEASESELTYIRIYMNSQSLNQLKCDSEG